MKRKHPKELPPREPQKVDEFRCHDCWEVGHVIYNAKSWPKHCPMCGAKND